jgi:hypothetical protein
MKMNPGLTSCRCGQASSRIPTSERLSEPDALTPTPEREGNRRQDVGATKSRLFALANVTTCRATSNGAVRTPPPCSPAPYGSRPACTQAVSWLESPLLAVQAVQWDRHLAGHSSGDSPLHRRTSLSRFPAARTGATGGTLTYEPAKKRTNAVSDLCKSVVNQS